MDTKDGSQAGEPKSTATRCSLDTREKSGSTAINPKSVATDARSADDASTLIQPTGHTREANAAVATTPNDTVGRPGAYAISGIGFPSEEVDQEANDNDNSSTEDGSDVVFEGFLPDPTPQERAQEMLRSAITLDDAAVRPINDFVDGSDENQSEAENGASKGLNENSHNILRSPFAFIILTLIILVSIALGVYLGSDATSSSSCSNKFQERFDVAKTIASSITSLETLDDTRSPQSKALDWITCRDIISSNLIDERDRTTGFLQKQVNGFKYGGDSGEAQVLRRYALAVFYFSTLEKGPWKEQWNFLSPDLHECSWNKNKTRSNFPYGDFDPAGLVCQKSVLETGIMLDDSEHEIGTVDLNFRIPNNLAGTLPPELGYLEDVTHVGLENQKGLYGSLPTTIGNMNIYSFSILFGGPQFGGVLPASLFSIPTVKYVTFLYNEGDWEFPTSITSPIKETVLDALNFQSTGLSGLIPSYLTEFTSLRSIDFSGNSLEGTIPDLGRLKSVEFVSFYDNNLNGTLPESLGQLTNLTVMGFGKNNFTGTLPQALGHLNKLQVLDLSYSKLEGTVPSGFSNLSNLEHVSLQQNVNLHGSISAFESLQSLSSLLLYSNTFSSTIPAKLFSNFSGQIFADFGHNNFTGKLPDTFSRYAQNISYLAIMGNDFDADAVDDAICKDTFILHADCSSCPCCSSCCKGDSVDKDNSYCSFDLDFYKLAGLECGSWWAFCHDAYYDPLPLD